jgi:bacterioferritin-associated ferredoxin
MKKAVTLLALATVAMSNGVEFSDDELNFFKNIGNGLKKAGQFVVSHPQIITTAVKILALEDENDAELFHLKDLIHKIEKGAEFVKDHPELIKDGKHIAVDVKSHDYKQLISDSIKTLQDLGFEDEELFHFKDLIKTIGKDVKKGADFVHSHPSVIGDAKNLIHDIKNKDIGHLIKDGVKTYKDIRQHDDDEELFKLKELLHKIGGGIKKGADFVAGHPALIGDGKNLIKDIKNKDFGHLIKDGIKTYKDIKQHDDEELFKFRDLIHDIKKGADFVHAHPQIIPDSVHIVKDIKTHQYKHLPHDVLQTLKDAGFDDEELFKFKDAIKKIGGGIKKGADFIAGHPAVIGDAKNLIKDVKNKDIGHLIKDGIKTYKDIKQHDDDEELFKLKDLLHKIGGGIKKGADFVAGHPALIGDAKNLIGDVKNKNIGGLIKDGFKTYKDITQHDDDELFNIGKIGNLVKDGAHIVKDVKDKNIGGLIKDGIKTFHDIKQHDDEELFNIGKIGNLVKDGVHIVKDVKDKNIGGLIKDGIKTFHDIKQHDDEELFNIKDLAHKIEKDVKKGVEFVQAHPQVIPDSVHLVKDVKDHKKAGDLIRDGVKIFKDLGFEDQTDNALFSLGDLIHDGINIANDIKTHNYGGLVGHGIQTVKDLKNKDKKFLF